MARSSGRQLTDEVAAKRLVVVPDLGRGWTVGDVAAAQRDRPEWLRSGRKGLAAGRAEEERQRRARYDAVLARRSGFEYPTVSVEAAEFAREFTEANLLGFLCGALGASAADIYVVDCGFDVSTHGAGVAETNRERAKRGVCLCGRDPKAFADYGGHREPGTLGDLFEAPSGNTRTTYVSGAGLDVSGAGLDAETWDDVWYDRWALEGLAHGYLIAGSVLRGGIDTLEVIAAVAAETNSGEAA